MVVSELVREIEGLINDNARFEAELIVMSALGLTRTQLVIGGRRDVTENEYKRAFEMAARRKTGEPLQYILGETEFMSLGFYVEKGVLIPRADTETLVETVIEEIRDDRTYKVLDICSGSGCVGISIAYYRNNVTADLVDIDDTALETGERNIVRNSVDNRVKILKKDILKEYPDSKYDIIVSNPPYIESDIIETLQTEVKNYEPRIALDGGADGLIFYRRIAKIAPELLSENGLIAMEIGYNQAEQVVELLKNNFDNIQVIKDLGGNDRVVTGRVIRNG